eukprot:TRINITY_DN4946_c0_g1_i6.p1 TRINITY_DN4946_c0_g1~~TRINITY_DN4946_c0_g1_i6.p1  ORF type:complete len:980 (+),score=172.18 TRINITY_DN4946_c0_g1_i6:90-2942(+)
MSARAEPACPAARPTVGDRARALPAAPQTRGLPAAPRTAAPGATGGCAAQRQGRGSAADPGWREAAEPCPAAPAPSAPEDAAPAEAVPHAAASGRLGEDLAGLRRGARLDAQDWGALRSRMRRFHPDCAADCGDGSVVADAPPPGAPVQWPPEWRPPERWGAAAEAAAGAAAGDEAAAVLRGALHELRRGLECLSRCPGCVAAPCSPRGARSSSPDVPSSAPATEPQPMLEWLLELPAQWAAALPPGSDDEAEPFARYLPWKHTVTQFRRLGGGRFHPGDFVCPGLHYPRPTPGKPRACCAVEDARRTLCRLLLSVDPDFDWEYWYERPEVPAGALQKLPVHDAVEGFLATFLYTYNLWLPHGRARRVVLPPSGEMQWGLTEMTVTYVDQDGRAAAAGLTAGDVILSVGGAELHSEPAVEQAIAQGATELVVAPSSGVDRPVQIYGAVNWAMRDRASAEGVRAQRLDRLLSVLKPFIWRLDRFIATMSAGEKPKAAVLFRGVSAVRVARYFRVDSLHAEPSFLSLSSSKEVAWGFAGEDGGTWVSAQVLRALPVDWASQSPDEEELLLGSNNVFRVTSKPTDDERQVLTTTHDAVGLEQVADAAGGALPQPGPEDILRSRVQGLLASKIIFKSFVSQYIQPMVTLAREGPSKQPGAPDGGPGPDTELRLFAAFDSFLRSDAQWLLVIASQGEGKSSALLRLYERELGELERPKRDPPPAQGAVPVFLSLPLIPAAELEEGWLRRQAERQLRLGDAGWALLEQRGVVAFADSADEAALQPEALRRRSLAARAGLPPRSKGVISVRAEDAKRLRLDPAHIAGSGGGGRARAAQPPAGGRGRGGGAAGGGPAGAPRAPAPRRGGGAARGRAAGRVGAAAAAAGCVRRGGRRAHGRAPGLALPRGGLHRANLHNGGRGRHGVAGGGRQRRGDGSCAAPPHAPRRRPRRQRRVAR